MGGLEISELFCEDHQTCFIRSLGLFFDFCFFIFIFKLLLGIIVIAQIVDFIKLKMVETVSIPKEFTLNNGMKLGAVGFGTFPIVDPAIFEQAIVEAGYRHLDTASFYYNAEELGVAIARAIEKGAVKREDLFITTKIWDSEYGDPESALRSQLAKMKLDYVDCYLIHWPNNLHS